MIQKKVYVCEDTIEGIFTAIYDAWASKFGHANIKIVIEDKKNYLELELFSEYIYTKTDYEKAEKVARSIKAKICEDALSMVCNTAWSEDAEKGDIIYRFLILGFSMGKSIVDCIQYEQVEKVFTISRNVGNEAHHFTGFIRFQEINNNILFAKIKPKNDLLRIIAPHFTDRLKAENFIIYDEKRKTAIIHPSEQSWYYMNADNLDLDNLLNLTTEEEEFQLLWKTFFDSIAIKERTNKKLQQNNLPKRFRSNMTEFL